MYYEGRKCLQQPSFDTFRKKLASFAEYDVKFLHDLFGFLFSKKSRLVLIPFLAVIMLFTVLFVVLANSPWAPFVYAVF